MSNSCFSLFPLLLLLLFQPGPVNATTTVNIDTTQVFTQISNKFLSWTMDAGETAHWVTEKSNFWYNTSMIALARNLGPSFLRYGGTSGDFTAYNFSGQYFPTNRPDQGETTKVMNGTVFDGLIHFATSSAWDLIYGANYGTYRTPSTNGNTSEWDPAAFESLLQYVKSNHYDVAGWELGNEPDLFYKHNITLTPRQATHDFLRFRKVVQTILSNSPGKIIGPDTALTPYHWLTPFMNNLTKDNNPLDVMTWHFYYGPGSSRPHGLSWHDFYKPEVLDKFLTSAQNILNTTGKWRQTTQGDLWVGETSSTYGGGTANASASFVAGFLWLDKLALAARTKHAVVCRQVFGHASYAAVGYDNVPNPDYYSALLWNRLVGNKVLTVSGDMQLGRKVRVYAFCTAKKSGLQQEGGVTVIWLNTNNATSATLQFSEKGERQVYALTSLTGLPTSRSMYLNGKTLLSVDPATGTPVDMSPVVVKSGNDVVVPPLSYGFVVLPSAGAVACRQE